MKKVIMSMAILLATFTSSLFALEWGGLINNGTLVRTPDFHGVAIKQTNEAYIWANGALNKNETLRFATEGMYRFAFDSTLRENENHGMNHVLDVNVLKLSGNFALDNNNLLFDLGRFNVVDKAGAYFNQKSDGLSLRYNTRNIKLGLYAGYTGLQNKNNVLMQYDYDNQTETKMLYDLTYGYVPIIADITFNRVGPLSITLQGSYFLDIKNHNNVAYATLGLKGNMSNIGSYSANIVASSSGFKDFALFGAADLTFFVNTNVLVMAGAEYASGKVDSIKMATFTPISVRPVAMVENIDAHKIAPHMSGIFMLGDLLISLNEKLSMSMFESKFIVNSLDSSLGVVYNVFSDLQLGATALATVDFNQKANNNFGIVVNASLSF